MADIVRRVVHPVALRIMADDYDGPDCVILAGMVDNAAPEDIIAKPVRAGKVGRLAGFAALAHVLEARRKAALAAGDEFIAERGESRRSEEHTPELQSLMRISYAVFCLKKK